MSIALRVFIQLGKTKNCAFDESQVLSSSDLRGVGNPSFSWESQIIIRQRDVWKKQMIPLIIHKKIYPWYASPSSDKDKSMPFFGVRRGLGFLTKSTTLIVFRDGILLLLFFWREEILLQKQIETTNKNYNPASSKIMQAKLEEQCIETKEQCIIEILL